MNQPRLMEALTVGTDDAEARIRELASGLSLEQQVQLLTGADIWSTHSLPDIGLGRIVLSDGPAGRPG